MIMVTYADLTLSVFCFAVFQQCDSQLSLYMAVSTAIILSSIVYICMPLGSKKRAKSNSDAAKGESPSTKGTESSMQSSGAKSRRTSLSDIQITSTPPKRSTDVKKKPNNAPIVVAVWKYSDEANDLMASFPAGERCYKISIEHEAWPDVTSRFIQSFGDFLLSEHERDADVPANLGELRREEDVIVNLTDTREPNPENAPLKNFGLCLYIAGDEAHMCDILDLVHKYVIYRSTHPIPGTDRIPWPPVNALRMEVHPHIGINVEATVSNFQRIQKQCLPSARELPINPFSTKMPTGNNFMVATVEVIDKNNAIVAWDGRTYPYRERFDVSEISRQENTNLRILNETQRDLRDEENYARVVQAFGDTVLRNVFINLRVIGENADDEDSPCFKLLAELKEMPSVFWEAY